MESIDAVKSFYINDIKNSLKKKHFINKDVDRHVELSVSEPQFNSKNETKKQKEVEVVVFKQSKQGVKNNISNSEPLKTKFVPDKNLIKAKKLLKQIEWDVTKFGMKGFSLNDKRKMEEERAIKLGAKPRKNKYINYKILMDEKKKQTCESQKQSLSKKKQRRKKQARTVFWKDSTATGKFGQVGKFNGGVLKLSRRDIKALHPTK